MAEFFFKPTPHKEAIAFIAGKPALRRDQFDKLLPELKAFAFTIAGVQSFDVLKDIRDRVATLPAGGDWDEIKAGIAEQLVPYFVDPAEDAETQEKQRAAAERRAELLIRTHGSQAYAATAYRLADAQRDLFPYWRYQSLGDAHVRPSHAALDGIVLPADHEFWASHTPPWDWGCRCQFIPLSEDDVEDLKKEDEGKPPELRSVLDPAQQKLLTDQRTLWRPANLDTMTGHPVPYSVASPAEKGQEGAFSWQPGQLGLGLADLEKRYDPKTWADFAAWAQKTKIPTTPTTVWQWLEKKSQAAPAPAPVPPPPPAAPAPAPVVLPPKPKAAPAQPPAPKPAPAPAPAPLPRFPDPAQMQKVRALGGSTGAELYEAPDGRLFVVKRGASASHLREEAAADELYRALGVPVPPSTLLETPSGPVKVADFIKGKTLSASTIDGYRDQIAEHFAADALLANWDVAGLSFDNLLADESGKVWRIDNGGSLRFRAQGGGKGDKWGEFPRELWTLRETAANAQTATIFGKLSFFDIAAQIDRLDAAALASAPAEIADVLRARLGHLKDFGRKAAEMKADGWKAGYADDLARQMLGIRETGLVKDLPALLKRSAGSVVVHDQDGNPFDHLRTIGKHATKNTASTTLYDQIVGAAKTINHHHSKGDTDYNADKIAAALAQKPKLAKMKKEGTAAEKKVAEYYLGIVDTIEQAKGDKTKTVPKVNPMRLPTDPKPPPASLVQRLAEYVKGQGGDWAHVEKWAGDQAGSSQSAGAAAYKYFLAQQLDSAGAAQFYRAPTKAAFAKVVPAAAEASYRATMTAHHAFIQEILAATEFDGNDRGRRRLRILRTEQTASAVPFKAGERGTYKRGVNESGSIFRPVFSGARTVTNVPHSRVTSLYFLERTPGSGGTFLLGDDENEATYMAHGLETLRVAADYRNDSPGTDSAKWEI